MIKLYELREGKKLSQRTMAEKLSISQSTYHNWENSITQPSIEQLIDIAKFFGVSVDYLIGNSDYEGIIHYNNSFLTQDETELIRVYSTLSDNGKKSILEFIKSIKLDN